jgi:hypothetical protein
VHSFAYSWRCSALASTTVRIQQQTANILSELVDETGRSKSDLLAAAVEAFSRQLLLERTNEAYAALRADATAWEAELEERAEWEATLGDGLDDE